jgi:hypothetical protein
MKASTFLKLFGWCGGTVTPKPDISFTVGEEDFQLVFANGGAVRWRLKERQNANEFATQPTTSPGCSV